MFNILSQITLKVKFLRNEEQHCLLPSLVDDFTCVHSKNALLTHILSTLFSSTSVLFSCTPFGTKSFHKLRLNWETVTQHKHIVCSQVGRQVLIRSHKSGSPSTMHMVGRYCCLMSSDVRWHIRDKLRPMPKHGSI